jgi:hypothetical protein
MRFAVFTTLALATLGACTGSTNTDGGDGGSDASDVPQDIVGPPPPMACRAGTTWDGASRAFATDQTPAWGLAAARGTNLSVPDLDGDGFADLVVLDGSYNERSDLTASPPVYHVQVLMNRPRDGGGRMFVDATQTSNLLALHDGTAGYGRVATHIAFADIDNDGDVDAVSGVYVQTGTGVPDDSGDRAVVMLNDGHGVFSFPPDSAITGNSADVPQLGGIAFTDQNRDGLIDVFMGYFYDPYARVEVGQQHQLFRGHGDGTFDDVTDMVGLTLAEDMASFTNGGQRRPLYGVTACDINDDGQQDLLGAAYGRQWNLLYVNNGDHYTEMGRTTGVAGDMNVDYTTDQSYLCYCQAHPTDIAYCPAGTPAPIYMCPLRGWTKGYNDQPWRLNGNTFSIACGDVDNDGDMDLYTAEIHHPDVGTASDVSEMLVNDSTGSNVSFSRPGRDMMGLTPGSGPSTDEGGLASALFDWDDDGRLDAYLGASDYPSQFGWVFHQNADGTFTEVGARSGFRHACPHGLALADFDHDGDVDIIVGSSTARDCAARWPNGHEIRIYENNASQANWTTIRLVGAGMGGANRSAIGARVRVTAGGVTQTREVMGVWGHFSGEGTELPVHVGLGANCMIDRIEVRWPNAQGTTQTFEHVVANYRIELREGDSAVRYMTE